MTAAHRLGSGSAHESAATRVGAGAKTEHCRPTWSSSHVHAAWPWPAAHAPCAWHDGGQWLMFLAHGAVVLAMYAAVAASSAAASSVSATKAESGSSSNDVSTGAARRLVNHALRSLRPSGAAVASPPWTRYAWLPGNECALYRGSTAPVWPPRRVPLVKTSCASACSCALENGSAAPNPTSDVDAYDMNSSSPPEWLLLTTDVPQFEKKVSQLVGSCAYVGASVSSAASAAGSIVCVAPGSKAMLYSS